MTNIAFILPTIGILPFIWALSAHGLEFTHGFLMMSTIFFTIGFTTYICTKKNFEMQVKKEIMPTLCSCFPDLKWTENAIQIQPYIDSFVIPEFSSSTQDDNFFGTHNNVNFEISEGEYMGGNQNTYRKNRVTRVVFKGVLIKLDMNKKFTSHTVIKADTPLHLSPDWNLKRTVLEDPIFENKFDVFTNDEVEARYLITTAFMERLNNMKTAFKAHNFTAAFHNGYLMFALSVEKDLFSTCSLFKKLDDSKQFFQMYEQIVSIIKLIDYFKLDQKIGL